MTYFVNKGHLNDIKRGRCLSFLIEHNSLSCERDTFSLSSLYLALGVEALHLWRIIFGILWCFLSLEGLQLGFDKLFIDL
jgi:hypothetical protein